MRLLILSDLHRQLWLDAAVQAQDAMGKVQPDLDRSKPDVVVLAGDIDVGDHAVAWIKGTFAGLPVIYVHGNHEGYGHNLDKVR